MAVLDRGSRRLGQASGCTELEAEIGVRIDVGQMCCGALVDALKGL